MSLVFAAITPHPPLLIPNIGKEESKKAEKTKQALEKLEQDLYLTKPEIIIVISPHGNSFPDAFSINAHTQFESNFKEFGDMDTKQTWHGSPELASKIDCSTHGKVLHTSLVSEEKLDHGSSVPLFFLTSHLPNVRILPVGYTQLPVKDHLEFGYLLKEIIMSSDKRIAVIASGDLSHGLTKDSPAGFSETGKEFDETIIKLLETKNTTGVMNMEEKFVEEAMECGYRSILILLGILKNMDCEFKNYSYEAPFGVGYLVGNFVI